MRSNWMTMRDQISGRMLWEMAQWPALEQPELERKSTRSIEHRDARTRTNTYTNAIPNANWCPNACLCVDVLAATRSFAAAVPGDL